MLAADTCQPRHAGVRRFFEQTLEVVPKPRRDSLGDARFDPALRVHQRVGAKPLDRRRGRQDGSRADQVLVRLRLFRFIAAPGDRRAGRAGASVELLDPATGSRVVLTTAHIYDRDPMACSLLNLAALCQRCHLGHDRAERTAGARSAAARKAWRTRKRRAAG